MEKVNNSNTPGFYKIHDMFCLSLDAKIGGLNDTMMVEISYKLKEILSNGELVDREFFLLLDII